MSRSNRETHPDELIAEVARTLDTPPEKLDELRDQIIRHIEGAKLYRQFNEKIAQPSRMKRKAAALRACLAKAQMLSSQIELFFSSVLDDMVDFDVNRNYEAFKGCLNDGIAASEGIERRIDVPKGKKPRNYNKYAAKTFAIELVNNTPSAFNKQIQNYVASLLYELLTGVPHVDIPESADDHKPPLIQTRGRIKSQR